MTLSLILWMSFGAFATCVSDLDYPRTLTLPTLESWSTDRLFGRATPETECRLVKSLAGLSDYFERRARDENPRRAKPRGAWAKGVCFAGTFRRQYDPKLTETKRSLLRRAEVLADGVAKPVFVRFANRSIHRRPDWQRDVRGLAMSVDLGAGRAQDFEFQNTPRAVYDGLRTMERSAQVRRGVMSGRIETIDGAPSWTSVYEYFRALHGTLIAARDTRAFAKAEAFAIGEAGWHDGYLTQTYYSAGSFALGDSNRDIEPLARVVRFGAAPCREHRNQFASEDEARAASRWRGNERPDYLGDDARASIGLAPACFNIFTSFLSEDPTVATAGERRAGEMIENAALTWAAPNYAVGELTIDRVLDDAACDDPGRAFDVVTHQVGVVPVGALNRARHLIEHFGRP